MTPERNKNNWYAWLMVVVFSGLAVSFACDWWGEEREMREAVVVDPEFYSKRPVRQPRLEATLILGDHTYRCNTCHQHLKPSQVQKSAVSAHPEILLNHGVNNYCAPCHHREDREQLVDINGEKVSFAQSHLTCLQCHGPIYRDWEKGVHGRMNDYWDKRRGEVRKLTCVACHDPHDPAFKPMTPAPAPQRTGALNSSVTTIAKDSDHDD